MNLVLQESSYYVTYHGRLFSSTIIGQAIPVPIGLPSLNLYSSGYDGMRLTRHEMPPQDFRTFRWVIARGFLPPRVLYNLVLRCCKPQFCPSL